MSSLLAGTCMRPAYPMVPPLIPSLFSPRVSWRSGEGLGWTLRWPRMSLVTGRVEAKALVESSSASICASIMSDRSLLGLR